jgi:hypothetical protein
MRNGVQPTSSGCPLRVLSDLGARSCEVRFTSMNGHRQAEPACLKSATSESAQHQFSVGRASDSTNRRDMCLFPTCCEKALTLKGRLSSFSNLGESICFGRSQWR